jgi:uncharacterized membrane protein
MTTSPAEAADAEFAGAGAAPGPGGPGRRPRWRRRSAGPVRAARAAALSPCTWLVLGGFAVLWAFAYNQYAQLQVGACDLGIFYQAVAGWAFHLYPYVPIKGYPQIGDHFSPILILLAPLLWIVNSPLTLVFAQTVLLCSSGIPVYLAVRRLWGPLTASLFLAAYLFSIGMQGSVAFPVHEVMFGAPLIAWGLERALAGRWTAASVLIGLTVFVKEDMGGLVLMFAVWLLINRRWRHALVLGVWGPLMTVIAIKLVIPYFNPNGFTYVSDYAQTLHASGFGGEIAAVLGHPVRTVGMLFDNDAKRALWQHLLGPVAFLSLASPIMLLAVPSLVASLLSSRPTEWSWDLYYQMPLMPVIFIGAAHAAYGIVRLVRRGLARGGLRRPAWLPRVVRPSLVAGLALGGYAAHATWHDTKVEQIGQWRSQGAFRSDPGWVADVHRALAVVPSGVDVRATNNLLIPLATRDTATLVGSHVDRGDWAAVDMADPQCPIGPGDIPGVLATLSGQGFRVVEQAGPIVVLHKV